MRCNLRKANKEEIQAAISSKKMMVILIVDGELMDVIEMMVDNHADLVVNFEADKVTKEMRKVD